MLRDSFCTKPGVVPCLSPVVESQEALVSALGDSPQGSLSLLES